jgi:hypothetical protein
VPELLYIDNGKDFDCYAFHGRTKWERRRGKIRVDQDRIAGILNHLQIKARFCWAYHGQSKPIERFFGTVESQFGRTWPTYCGDSPENRPEELERRLAAGEAPTLEEFAAQFDSWLERNYHVTPHLGDGMEGRSPAAVYDASWNGHAKRTAPESMLDLLLTRQTREISVRKNGVMWEGLGYGQYCPELIPLAGKPVYLRIDERDLSRVQVWTADDKFVCLAPSNQRLPANATDQEKREAIARKKSHSKLLRNFYGQRPRLTEDLATTMIRARQESAAVQAADRGVPPGGIQPSEPPALRPVRTGIDAELAKVQGAVERSRVTRADGEPGSTGRARFEYVPKSLADEEEQASEIDAFTYVRGTGA